MHNPGSSMRIRWLAVIVCLVGWASSPVAALMVSVHILEHGSESPSPRLDPRFAASHGHHHEVDVPDHSHKILPSTEIQRPDLPDRRLGEDPMSTREPDSVSSCPIPVALPPPRYQALCVMLL